MVELILKVDLVKMEVDKQQLLMVEVLVDQVDQNQNLSSVEAGKTSSGPKTEEEIIHPPEEILVEVVVVVGHLEMEVVALDHGMDMEAKGLVEDLLKPCCTA